MIVDPQGGVPETATSSSLGSTRGGLFTCVLSPPNTVYIVYNCCNYHSGCCMDCFHSRFEIVVDLQMAAIPKTNAALKKIPILH